jgi:membrane protein DedA with SNARE-associated domain
MFTAIGAGIWVVILALVGYWLGSQGDLALKYVHKISLALISICSVTVIIYVVAVRRRNSDKNRS